MQQPLFDYTPLERRVSFAERFQPGNREWLRGVWYMIGLCGLIGIGTYLLLPSYGGMAGLVALLAGFCVLAILVLYVVGGESIKKRAFAQRNWLVRREAQPYDGRQARPFGIGTNRLFVEQFFDKMGRFEEVGVFRFRTGKRPRHFSYIRLKLPRRLPHMALCKTGEGGAKLAMLGGVGAGIDKSQHLSLEGNFDQYFTLFAPKEYERDALYVFTPDVMELFMNGLRRYDCEIIDDDLYIYADEVIEFAKKEEFQEVERIILLLSSKLYRQTRRYADEAVADRSVNQVTAAGRRLKTGRLIGVAVFILLAVLLYLWQRLT